MVTVSNHVYTVENQVFYFQDFIKQLLWYFEAQRMLTNTVALEPFEHPGENPPSWG